MNYFLALDDMEIGFGGTRVPVRNLFDYLLAGENIKDFLEDFPTVSFEQIRYILQSHT